MSPLRPPSGRRLQRGVTLMGLMFWAGLVGFVAYVAVRTVPTVNEYYTVQGAVDKIAANPPATVAEIRRAFDRQKEIEYAIQSISSADLEISKENDRVVIAFAYDKEVPLFGPVYLLLKYQGRSK
jgi:hypothetical protein